MLRSAIIVSMLACGAAIAGDDPSDDALAERRHLRALAAQQRAHGANHPKVDAAYDDLAEFYSSRGRYADAEKLIRRLLGVREKAWDPWHPRVADTLTYLAHLQLQQRHLEEAEHSARRAAEIYESARDSSQAASAVGMLVSILVLQDRYPEADVQARRAVDILQKARGPAHADVADALANLAAVSLARGELYEAEQQYLQVLAIRESIGGTAHAVADADTLASLAQAYEAQGRADDAHATYARALAVWKKKHAADHPAMTDALSGLGRMAESLGRSGEAEGYYRRALALAQLATGPEDPSTAGPLNELAVSLFAQQRYLEAEPLYRRSLELEIAARGADHPLLATVLTNLAELYQAQRRDAQAESYYLRAIALLERALGPDHPALATRLIYLAGLYRGQGKLDEALQRARRASAILAAGYTLRRRGPQPSALAGLRADSWQFEQHVAILADVVEAAGSDRDGAARESFEVAQRARVSDTAEQVAVMAARHATGDDALAKLVRSRQDELLRLGQVERAFVALVSGTKDDPAPARAAELHQIARDIRAEIERLDGDIDRDYPRYWELIGRKPLPLDEAQRLLGSEEALLVFLAGREHAYAWFLGRNGERFLRVALPRDELAGLVKRLRSHLDLGAEDAGAILQRPFDVAAAHDLYRRLFAPFEQQLMGVKNLFLVADGPLQSLPPGVLVTELPANPVAGIEEYASLAWLTKKYALTVLPAVSSLRALREFARPPASPEPFVGFGDPLLEGGNPGSRSSRTLYSRGAVADADAVRKLASLPDSAIELRAIAAALNASPDAVRLGSAATERAVKESDLARYRNLAFATHGLIGGEFRGLAEPALVLTPPAKASALDDGLLTASEISRLKLDADWVVLSACNTAAPDGTPGAEGLSGLARAFFYAGARSLLVSHWAVHSEAAVALTTRMFQETARGAPKAEALRRSMLALMQSPDKPYFAHPAFWAPFVLVGEGAAGRPARRVQRISAARRAFRNRDYLASGLKLNFCVPSESSAIAPPVGFTKTTTPSR